MNRPVRPLGWALLGCFLFAASPLSAQEVGLSFVTASSDHVEFPDPEGFSVAALIDLTPYLIARVGVTRLNDNTTKEGTVCQVYSPRIECNPAMTETDINLTGFRAGLMFVHWFGEYFRFGLGGGGSFNQVGVESNGVSGQMADFLKPGGGQLGAQGYVSLSVAPYPRIPFRITGGYTYHWVNFHVCSGENVNPPVYDPLCEPGHFQEIELGLAYYFARR